MICDWCSSEQLCKEWKNMCLDGEGFNWNNIEITWENSNIDYYIIINKPNPKFNEYYEPSKTIIYQMEPWVCFKERKWGVKSWGDWSIPDENKFLHEKDLNKFQKYNELYMSWCNQCKKKENKLKEQRSKNSNKQFNNLNISSFSFSNKSFMIFFINIFF